MASHWIPSGRRSQRSIILSELWVEWPSLALGKPMIFWMDFLDGLFWEFWMDVFFFDFWEEKCEGEVEAEMNLTVHFVLWVILSAKFHESNIFSEFDSGQNPLLKGGKDDLFANLPLRRWKFCQASVGDRKVEPKYQVGFTPPPPGCWLLSTIGWLVTFFRLRNPNY